MEKTIKERRKESIKMQNLKEGMVKTIILHLYNLGIMVDESIYKIKIDLFMESKKKKT